MRTAMGCRGKAALPSMIKGRVSLPRSQMRLRWGCIPGRTAYGLLIWQRLLAC